MEVAQNGALVMWRKQKTGGKPLIQYRHTTHFNLEHWNASLWSIICFHSPIEGTGGSPFPLSSTSAHITSRAVVTRALREWSAVE